MRPSGIDALDLDLEARTRKRQIEAALNKSAQGIGVSLLLRGASTADFIKHKELILESLRNTQTRILQEFGVLDENEEVIPGQEIFAPKAAKPII